MKNKECGGNVMFNMWSDFGDIDSGINFIEITKL